MGDARKQALRVVFRAARKTKSPQKKGALQNGFRNTLSKNA
jgi:hypothetical protein